jgi:hypothetical protein
MKYYLLRILVLPSLFVLLGQQPVSAQTPVNRPPVSPYLNLLRTGTSPAINYYGIVRPQIDFRNSVLQLQQQTANNQQSLSELQASSPLTTGHAAQFMNHTRFFMTMGKQGAFNRNVVSGPFARPAAASPARASSTATPQR